MRTVGAKLVADVADFEAGMAAAEESTKSLADELEKTGLTAKEEAEKLEKLTAASVIAGKEQETFGRSALTAAQHLEKLDREIKATEKELQLLAVSFVEAGTAAERLDLSKAIRKSQSDLRTLNKSKGLIEDLLPSPAELQQVGRSISKDMAEGLSGLGGELMPAVIIALAASAPAIGAVISGAIIGGAGIGGIVGGLLLTKSDPRVADALKTFGLTLKTRMQADAQPFVGVWLDSIKTINNALNGIDFKGLFSDAAKQAGPLIHGIADGVQALGHGLTDLIHNAGPDVAAIGSEIGTLGHVIGDGLSSLADNGKEGADALHNLFEIVNLGVGSTFALINALTETYGWLRKIGGPGVVDALSRIGDLKTPISGYVNSTYQAIVATKLGTTSVDQFGRAFLTAGPPLESFTTKVDDLAAAGRSLFDSTTNVAQSVADFEKALKANGKTLDENTQKGRNNRQALSAVASSLVGTYDAYVKVNGEGIRSNAIAGQNRERFIALAGQLGLTKRQAEALATQMGLIPAKKTTDFYANTHDAAARIKALQQQVNSLHGKSLQIAVSTNIASVDAKVQNTLARLAGRALGGPVLAGQAYIVGEKQPEVFVPDVNGTIVPSLGQAKPHIMSYAGGGTQKIVVEHHQVYDFANASNAMAQAIISTIRTNAGVRTSLVKAMQIKGQG